MSARKTMLAVSAASAPELTEWPRPVPGSESEVLVRVERVGICGTDRAIAEGGYTDFEGVLGHELAGQVVEADLYAWMRRRVTASINIPASPLGSFDSNTAKHDPGRSALGIRGRDGAMAEYVALPEGLLVALPDRLSYAAGALAEPLAAAMDAAGRIEGLADPVLIVGDGPLAQLCIRVLRASGRDLHVWGHHQAKLERAAKSGARVLKRAPRAARYMAVIEAAGSATGLQTALDATAPTGRLVLQSTLPGTVELKLGRIAVDEIELVGSRCGDVARAVAWLEAGRVEVEDLVSDCLPLADAPRAFARSRQADALKVQLSPHGR